MKKKHLIITAFITIIALIIINIGIIYFKNRNVHDDNMLFTEPKDIITLTKLTDEEYNKLSKEIISNLEYTFGKEGGFQINNIEKGTIRVGDIANPLPYQKAEVYTKFLNKTFDGKPSSFIFLLLQEYENELNNKIKKINKNINVSIIAYHDYVTDINYGHIPTLAEIPNENYNILLWYTSENKNFSSNNINEVINLLKTDFKETYYIILEKDSSYNNRNFEIRYLIESSRENYNDISIENNKYISISINPIEKTINLEGYNIDIHNETFNLNEIF